MEALTQKQKDTFWRDGVIVLENAVSADELTDLRSEFLRWVHESRAYNDDYGETLDGRPRFDLQPGHNADTPGLRRVQSPEEVSDVFAGIMRDAAAVDFFAELIGPSIRCHHGKVNSKRPGTATQVKWHQDFPFEPNLSDTPHAFYIPTYYAKDAIKLSPNHLPSNLTHELVHGEACGRVRCTPYEMALPAVPKGTSFFAQQEGADAG